MTRRAIPGRLYHYTLKFSPRNIVDGELDDIPKMLEGANHLMAIRDESNIAKYFIQRQFEKHAVNANHPPNITLWEKRKDMEP